MNHSHIVSSHLQNINIEMHVCKGVNKLAYSDVTEKQVPLNFTDRGSVSSCCSEPLIQTSNICTTRCEGKPLQTLRLGRVNWTKILLLLCVKKQNLRFWWRWSKKFRWIIIWSCLTCTCGTTEDMTSKRLIWKWRDDHPQSIHQHIMTCKHTITVHLNLKLVNVWKETSAQMSVSWWKHERLSLFYLSLQSSRGMRWVIHTVLERSVHLLNKPESCEKTYAGVKTSDVLQSKRPILIFHSFSDHTKLNWWHDCLVVE